MFEEDDELPDLSVLINGTMEDILEFNKPFLEELKNKRAEEDVVSFIHDAVKREYPNLPFYDGWEKYKEKLNE